MGGAVDGVLLHVVGHVGILDDGFAVDHFFSENEKIEPKKLVNKGEKKMSEIIEH